MDPDLFLMPHERRNAHTRIDDHLPEGTAWSVGNTVRPLVHGATYFAELHERVSALGEGDLLYFVDWRGDPDQQLTEDPAQTVSATFSAAARRGVDVRGLVWRSHWKGFGFHARKSRLVGLEINEAGGQCLRDMRVRTGGAHHQKFAVLRHRQDPARDIAFVGGIDLCHSRRDDAGHRGDPQTRDMPRVFGPRPAWHDVQVAITGPAVHDVETSFRERWGDSTPLTMNPGRRLSSLVHGEDLEPRPLHAQAPPPPESGHEAVQVLRTYPTLRPKGFDFAPQGERSIADANTKAVRKARRLIYLEDQYLWSEEVGRHFGQALRENPDLRLIAVIPAHPDTDGALSLPAQLHGRKLAMDLLLAAGGDRVAVYGLTNLAGLPVYVHAKVCIIDDVWSSIGSDNFNRRSWSSDSELACAVQDHRAEHSGPAVPGDAFALRLRRELTAEHLGVLQEEVPDDVDDLWDAMAASADALDAWYADGRQPRSVKGRSAWWPRRSSAAGGGTGVGRPAGRLRRLSPPEPNPLQTLWGSWTYPAADPDGTLGRADHI